MITQRILLNTHFVSINSPVNYKLWLNDDKEHAVEIAGGQCVQYDIYKMLPEKFVQMPQWKMYIEYDEAKLSENEKVIIDNYEIDLGNNMSALGGERVSMDLTPILDKLSKIKPEKKYLVPQNTFFVEEQIYYYDKVRFYPHEGNITLSDLGRLKNKNFLMETDKNLNYVDVDNQSHIIHSGVYTIKLIEKQDVEHGQEFTWYFLVWDSNGHFLVPLLHINYNVDDFVIYNDNLFATCEGCPKVINYIE